MIEIRDENNEVTEVRITAQDFINAGLLSAGGIILPGHPLYDVSLFHNLPPGWRQQAMNSVEGTGNFLFRQGSALMTPVTETELTEYFRGGEYEARLAETGESLD